MAFSVETKDEAYKRSGGRCECTRQHAFISDAPHHGGRCRNTFTRNGKWETHHKLSVSHGGDDSLSNCEVLCPACHQLTQSFGNN